MKQTEMKTCPFCGGDAEIYETPHVPRGTDYTPRCKNPSCCGRLTKKYSTKQKAINAWNRRATDNNVGDKTETMLFGMRNKIT